MSAFTPVEKHIFYTQRKHRVLGDLIEKMDNETAFELVMACVVK